MAAALAALSALSALRPSPPPTTAVAVAARDLPSGTRLAADDVGTARLPPGTVPDGSFAPGEVPFGRLVAAPVRRGEPLTDARVVGPGLADGLSGGQVLASVDVASATALLVRPGDVVDVVAGHATGTGSSGSADVVASGATVVAVPRGEIGSHGRALVLAVDATAALDVVQTALVAPLQVLVRPRPLP